MSGSTTVEESGVCIIDNLIKREALVLSTRGKWIITRLVANLELRRFSDGMVVGIPDETNSVSNGGVDSEWNISKNALSGSNNDGMRSARTAVARASGVSWGWCIGCCGSAK